jgi:hypothetical protein
VVSPAELAVVGGAAGVGAVVGALAAAAHVSWAGQRWLVPLRPAPSVDVIDRQLTRLLQAGGTPADGGRALLRAVGPARPYDWARDGEAVA